MNLSEREAYRCKDCNQEGYSFEESKLREDPDFPVTLLTEIESLSFQTTG